MVSLPGKLPVTYQALMLTGNLPVACP